MNSDTNAAGASADETSEDMEVDPSPKPQEMKRSAVKELIERYFYQLQNGCGNPLCANSNCASSGKVVAMTPNEIAAKAIQLFSQDAKLCDIYQPQVSKTAGNSTATQDSPTSSSRIQDEEMGDSSTSSSTFSGSSNSTTTTSTNTDISACHTPSNELAYPSTELLQFVVNEATHNPIGDEPHSSSSACSLSKSVPTFAPVNYLNEHIIDELIEDAKENNNNYARLLHAINEVYPNVDKLSKSFCRSAFAAMKSSTANKLHELLGKSPGDLKKEDLRTLEGDKDKDEDSTCCQDEELNSGDSAELPAAETNDVSMEQEQESIDVDSGSASCDDASSQVNTDVDLESLRRVKKKLSALQNAAIGEAINTNIILLAEHIKYSRETDWEKILHCFVICFDMATNTSNSFADLEYLERSLPKLCHAARILPISAQAKLARIWATHCKDQLQSLVQCCQQLITLQVILDEEAVQENSDVIAVTKLLKIAFYANLLAGEWDNQRSCKTVNAAEASAATNDSASGADVDATNEDDDIFFYSHVSKPQNPLAENKLEQTLKISAMDCRVPLIPFEEFYNEPLSDAIQMDRDYLSYKNLLLNTSMEDIHFCFMFYSFILTPATKVIALYYDSRIRMYTERSSSLYSLLHYYSDNNEMARPDLKLKVRRSNIIDDALIGLELVAMSNPKDLKKQLVVEFVGEEGIDEGGVSKEFFQLIVDEIFNPDFGMFTHQEETNTMWFNSAPFENEAQFTLVGIILGLAIYNNIILAVNFPMVVYRKLMGGRGTFFDLNDWNPSLWRSLKSMLDYEEHDMETVFMQTFKISYSNVFGEMVEHELKAGGADIAVNQSNKREFVDLYSDFLLNESIQRQFKAFKKGFDMVTDESPLKLLFRPEEIELLVCGSRKFDFVELETSTEYEGGYTKDSQVIKDFWEVVHAMPEESKRKLLEFTTGSDRIPVGGLSRLKLLITRHGSDSDRLPTSHTCFNVLLLPEYESKSKLEERLLKAINYSKGFGML